MHSSPSSRFEPSFGDDSSAADATLVQERLVFTGSGSEYFRIWIVNLLLTIVTLGIYSAWAKVRRTRYFYDSTQLAGTSFEYHGNPIAILKGRIVAVALIVVYNMLFNVAPVASLLMLVVFMVAVPWLVWKSLQFKLYNSSYRGIRFGFRGSAKEAYKVFLLYPIASVFTANLLAPFVHQRIKRFQHNESRFGSSFFSFDASVGGFYKTYLIFLLIALASVAAVGMLFGGTMAGLTRSGGLKSAGPAALFGFFAFALALMAVMSLMTPIFMTMIQKLIWNHTRLGEHQFHTDLKWTRVAFIMLTNMLGIALTLGLYTPFAQIRAMRYRVESMTLAVAGSLDAFIAQEETEVSATGEGMADLLDFDLSL